MRITSIDNLIRVNRHFPDAPFPTLDPRTSGKSLTTPEITIGGVGGKYIHTHSHQ